MNEVVWLDDGMKATDQTPANPFGAWLNGAREGDRIDYHRGLLANDRDVKVSTLTLIERDALADIASQAMRAYQSGLVDLVQRRNGENDYTYTAVRRGTRRPRI